MGEPDPTRGRQTLCKFYHDNEILNEQLQRIKSAQTVNDFEKLLQEQLRRKQSAKSIEYYYDFEDILRHETCLREKIDVQNRSSFNQLLNENNKKSSLSLSYANLLTSSSPLEASVRESRLFSVENFASVAAECYEKCVNVYLNDLSAFNRRVEREKQSFFAHIDYSIPLKLRQVFDDSSLVNRINSIKISFESKSLRDDPITVNTRQSIYIPRVSRQTMSSNDSNNNRDDSTNQVKDPPKIVLSDHSTNKNIIQGDIVRSYSDKDKVIDKSCYLTVPIGHFYSGEARPP